MKKSEQGMTRRDFLCSALGLILTAPAGISVLAKQLTLPKTAGEPAVKALKKSKVILVRNAEVLGQDRRINAKVLAKMLDDAVTALTGEAEPVAAWKQIVKPTDTVGVKSNAWHFLPTPPELEQAIKKRLLDAGVSEDRISIDDRGVLRNPVFQKATALINARPLRTHDWSGVGSLIKNYIMFTPSPPRWHGDSCANLAALWDLPQVKGKTRLNILVMLTPLFYGKGAHHFQKQYTWEYKGLLVGTDPVACDATGVRILQAKRRAYFGKDLPFDVSPKHIRIAEEKFKLGFADANRIELQKLGWMTDALI